jgi:signal peptidase I
MGMPDPLLLGMAPAPVAANHPRAPPIAALLALLCPGLGHFYCARVAPALLWSIAPHLALLGWMSIGVFDAPRLHLWLLAGVVSWLGLRLLQAAIAWRLASRLGQYTLRPLNNAALYLGFLLGTSIFTSLISGPFRELVVEPFKVSNASMQPSLAVGDQLFVVKRGPYAAWNRGDVVVYRPPQSVLSLSPSVGRVMGLSGDRVEVQRGVFFVNGVEAPLAPCDPPPQAGPCFTEGAHRIIHHPSAGTTQGPVAVPKGQLFIAGDNRENALDSREFGPVAASGVVGRVAVVWLSLDSNFQPRVERFGIRP